jgi:hypothetical protein
MLALQSSEPALLFCLLIPFIIIFGIGGLALTVIAIDVAMNRGKEYGVYNIPYMTPDMVMMEIHRYFMSKGYKCQLGYYQIVAKKGEAVLMGVRTFIFHVQPAQEGGSVIHSEMYLEGLIPKYMKFSKWGYLAILPRRMGRKRKEELFQILGISEVGGMT